MDFKTGDNIKELAIKFAALGGMDSEQAAAWVVYEHLVEAVEMAPDHTLACRIASAIVKGFDY